MCSFILVPLTNAKSDRPEEFVGMNVMVLGQGNSAADCAVVRSVPYN